MCAFISFTFVIELIIGFEHTTYLVKEGNVVEVCAVLTGKIKRVLVFFVNSSNGSATGTHQILLL